MKGIECCGQCADYSYKLHKCTRGFSQGVASDSFYTDCDLPEAEPVKYGRWELISQNKFTGTKTLRCTYCKNYFVVRDDTLNAGRGDANFCPNCGSKNRMGGDGDA